MKKKKQNNQPVTSYTLSDNSLIELLYDDQEQTTKLALWQGNDFKIKDRIFTDSGKVFTPYGPENPLLNQRVVLFPSEPEEYRSEKELLHEIQSFIHRYVDVSEVFETVSGYYILLTWIYDNFNEVPYLRLRGDYGSGKTRFLQTVGSLCYKPIFASGASTVAPLFHILNQVGGTLVLDEGDFRFSDEKTEIAKILNNGNAKGFPVLRCEKINQKEFAPKAYNVFGPKIIASRHDFSDQALESRFITEDVGLRKVRKTIPVTLPDSFHTEAKKLRNKLLFWRFKNYNKKKSIKGFHNQKLERRLNQVYLPLLSLIEDEKIREQIIRTARNKNDQIRTDRGFQVEADVLASIKKGYEKHRTDLSVSDITNIFTADFSSFYEQKITPKWIGSIIRRKLRLSTRKKNGVYILSENQKDILKNLYSKYDV